MLDVDRARDGDERASSAPADARAPSDASARFPIDVVVNREQRARVYDADACALLRCEGRITGAMIGALPGFRSQDVARGLPLELGKEEATLARDRGFVRFVYERGGEREGESRGRGRDEEIRNAARAREKASAMAGKARAEAERRAWGGNGARKKAKVRNDLEGYEKAIETTFVSIPLTNASDRDGEGKWEYPSTEEERERYAVFADLYDRNYSITSGAKFGSDYLVYPGDPMLYHAHYTVRIVRWEATLHPLVVAATTRMAHAARKNFVIAAVRAVRDANAGEGASATYEVRYFTMEADVDLSSNRGF